MGTNELDKILSEENLKDIVQRASKKDVKRIRTTATHKTNDKKYTKTQQDLLPRKNLNLMTDKISSEIEEAEEDKKVMDVLKRNDQIKPKQPTRRDLLINKNVNPRKILITEAKPKFPSSNNNEIKVMEPSNDQIKVINVQPSNQIKVVEPSNLEIKTVNPTNTSIPISISPSNSVKVVSVQSTKIEIPSLTVLSSNSIITSSTTTATSVNTATLTKVENVSVSEKTKPLLVKIEGNNNNISNTNNTSNSNNTSGNSSNDSNFEDELNQVILENSDSSSPTTSPTKTTPSSNTKKTESPREEEKEEEEERGEGGGGEEKGLLAIDLVDQGLDDSQMVIELSKLPHSQPLSLAFGGNDMQIMGAQTLGEILLHQRVLIKTLQLQWNLLASEGVAMLINGLLRSTCLTLLDLTGNELEEEGAIAISAALKGNKSLKSLILSENNIGSGGAIVIMHALKYNKTLTGIDLSNNNIFEDGILKVSEVLMENDTLSEVVLNGNFVSDEGAIGLGKVIERNKVRSLYLQNCQIGDGGIEAILNALPKNNSLEELDITLNNFSSIFLIRFQHFHFLHPNKHISWFVDNFDYSLLDSSFIQQIILHFGFSKIFEVFLNGNDFMPLISNEVLIPCIELPDDPSPFLHSLFQLARVGQLVFPLPPPSVYSLLFFLLFNINISFSHFTFFSIIYLFNIPHFYFLFHLFFLIIDIFFYHLLFF
eukprot:TRINITY_DN2842_c0_g1_i2.p1 TRINITY_DN2842_c0_g1~~TRINITY_DN2842_c0_g1_i2.p1  ORF type:complete len:749 (-),score=243.87 TRINITY_DN2842_c0_g1_i2:835-2964(-)